MSEVPITERRLVVRTPAMDRVSVDRDLRYGHSGSDALTFDVYRPGSEPESSLPAVIFITGFPETGAMEATGSYFKDWASYIDWARLVASSGMIASTYRNEDPVRDIGALVANIGSNAESLGIDANRLGAWSCSGNTATALSAVHEHEAFKCAALCYGYMIDIPGHDEVARAAEQFGFVNATEGMQISEIRPVPLLIARGGRDEMPGLNDSLDRFVTGALAADLPLSLVNYANGAHAFDISDETEGSGVVIRQILQFLRLQLLAVDE